MPQAQEGQRDPRSFKGNPFVIQVGIARQRFLPSQTSRDNGALQTRRPFVIEQNDLNSKAFAAVGGRGLLGLAKDLRPRCQEILQLKGNRLPK